MKCNVGVRHAPDLARKRACAKGKVWGDDRHVAMTLHASGLDRTFRFRLVNDGDTFALLHE